MGGLLVLCVEADPRFDGGCCDALETAASVLRVRAGILGVLETLRIMPGHGIARNGDRYGWRVEMYRVVRSVMLKGSLS